MKLAQLHIPLAASGRNGAVPVDPQRVQKRITERFGGITATLMSPVTGLWKGGDGPVEEDRRVVFDVIIENADLARRRAPKLELEKRLEQKEI